MWRGSVPGSGRSTNLERKQDTCGVVPCRVLMGATGWLRVGRRGGRLWGMDAATVNRSIRLDAPADELWRSLASGDGLSGWLAERVDLVVEPGAAGIAVDR